MYGFDKERSEVIDKQYAFEYEVGLWSLGKIQVLKDRQTSDLKICKTVDKSLLNSNINVEEAVSKLKRLMSLRHDYVSTTVKVLEDKQHIFIISDKTSGNDVAEWLERTLEEGNWVQEEACAAYVRQMLVAAAHSHGYRVYHRELRPSNLLLTSKLPDAHVQISDFGISSVLDPTCEVLQKQDNPYLAPELLEHKVGSKVNGSASDIWSIGAIAHALLVGKPPSNKLNHWGRLSRDADDAASWTERSTASYDFVRLLLKPAPDDRPTAAQLLRHPWLQEVANRDPTACAANNMLCYNLGVLLIPETVEFKNFHALRAAFREMDDDEDGFVAARRVQDLLVERGVPKEYAAAGVAIADVNGVGVLDLCSAAVAELLAQLSRESAAQAGGPGATPPSSQSAADLAPRLLKRFFSVYGDSKHSMASIPQIRTRLCTALGREVEVKAGVSYDEMLSCFAEDAVVNSQSLIAELSASEGRGTPLYLDEDEEFLESSQGGLGDWGFLGLESIDDLFANVFHSCGRFATNGGSQRGGTNNINRLITALGK
jgi:hypothetical protein